MSNNWTVEKSNYFSEVLDESAPAHSLDYLIRVCGSTAEDIEFSVTGTEKFKAHFGNIFGYFKIVRDTLKEVILSQKRSLEYHGVYNAFLMGQTSEIEFTKIAKKFTYKPKSISAKILSSKINVLFNITEIDYSPSELADLFHCNINDVTTAIQLMPGSKSLGDSQ
ncbi:MAG TPA: hypothetical protein VJA64_06195 [Desulfobaccales bacterium]|nr:hypothetical protein [Desulfobaccales bacterium]